MAQKFICKVTAPGISSTEIEVLQKEIEKSIEDPNHVIITNYDFQIEFVPIDGVRSKTKKPRRK